MRDALFWILDTRYMILDTGFSMLDIRCSWFEHENFIFYMFGHLHTQTHTDITTFDRKNVRVLLWLF